MTILFLARRFYPQIGGVEKHVLEISKRLIKKGHRVIVITEEIKSYKKTSPFVKGGSGEISDVEGIEIIRINTGKDDWFKKFRIWQEMWKLRNYIKHADIIHCHDVFYWYMPFRLIYPRKRVYTTFHGYESYPIKRKAVIIRKISEKLSLGNICIGDFMKKWYAAKPTFVSYGAVEINNKKIMENGADEGARLLDKGGKWKMENNYHNSALFFGRLDDQTGILEYIETYELIKKKVAGFKFLVVGGGPYKKQIEKKIKLTDFQKNPEKYFQNYRYAFVSRYLSILEAFAAKRLVFALYDNPVKEDYLKMAPYSKYIIIENKSEKMAERIIYYINHPEKEKEVIEKAYNWVLEQTWEKLTEKYLSLWKK